MQLLLFDIDGTLINSHGAGRAVMTYALERLFGTAGPVDSYNMAGKTDPRIITDLLLAAGFPAGEITARLPEVYALMAQRAQETFGTAQITPCAGVPELLAALQTRPGVILGLVTGNTALTAPLKLAAAGIDPAQFSVGAFGSDEQDRNLLPALAIRRTAALTGQVFSGRQTVVIGDTPADIICARAGQARAVAVASGRYSRTTLERYRPDHLLDNLSATAAVVSLLLDGAQQNAETVR